MALAQEKLYTIDDIYALPDGKRAELIDGELYMMSPPGTTHQRIVSFLNRTIGNYIQEQNGDCEIFPAPFAVFLNNDEHTYVEPDISVICDKSKLDEKGCNGAPDWVIEIVSPSSKRMDYFIKLFKYQKAGVREYWIIDPERKAVTVYFFEANVLSVPYTFDSTIKVNIYDDLYINFSEIADLLDR